MSTTNMTEQEVQVLVENCLTANGCNSENAAAVGRTIAAAERDGCASHGLFRMPGYIASLRSGKVNGSAKPSVTKISPAVIKVDGDHGYAPTTTTTTTTTTATTLELAPKLRSNRSVVPQWQ